MKRLIDIIGSLVGIILLVVITPLVGLAILIEDGWPIFIKQKRVSRGKVIQVYKFRSMVKNAEELKKDVQHLNERSDGPFFKIKKDPRVTKVGKFLRKIKIDEFPQFINVLQGKISLVGPRPHGPDEAIYPEKYKHILLEKGGLTCISQTIGDPCLPFEREMELDIHYINNKSTWLDVKIIAKTIKILLIDRNGV